MQATALTVAICTMDRPGPLRDTMAALAGQDATVPWDVLVMDEGRVPVDADALRAALAGRAGLRVSRKGVGDAPGLYGSRLACVRECAAPLVLFLDDDAVPARDYIGRLSSLADASPDASGFGGVDTLGLPATAPAVALAYARFFGVAGPGPGSLGRSGHNHAQMTWRGQDRPFRSEFLHGCNMAFRTAALRGLPDLPWLRGHSCCEDLVLSTHAARSGPLLVDPGLSVEHALAPGGRGDEGARLRATLLNHARFQAWRRPGASRTAYAVAMAGLLGKDLTRKKRARGLPARSILSCYLDAFPEAMAVLGRAA